MTKISKLLVVMLLAFGFNNITAQEGNKGGLEYVGEVSSMKIVPSLSSKSTLVPATPLTEEPNDARSSVRRSKAEVIPGKDPQTEDDILARFPGKLDKKIDLSRNLENDFIVNNTVGSPSDPALAVGPDHVMIVFNTGFIIYDKDGNALTGPLNVNNIFSNGGCCDLTASYDNAADRWVLSYLFVGAGIEIAVSDGPDPLTANWFLYSIPQVNDYNKLSIWRDGYYVTDNGPMDVWALDRTAALAGDASANIQGFTIPGVQGQGFTSAQVLNVADSNLPTTGGAPLVYMRDNAFAGVTVDAVNIWTVNVDFANPGNSNVSAPEVFPVTPFINVFDGGAFDNLAQPGGGSSIDALQSTIMNQAQFRKFATHNSAIFNFVVDVDASAGELAGIRWYEFRQDGDGMPWTMAQEGTYTAPDGRHAWNGSMSIDFQGNIGLGYNSMAGPTTPNPTSQRVGAYYTGHLFTADPGVMDVAEVEFGMSNANIPGFRFGDYAKMDIDPSNNQDFWFITEYLNTNHVAVFQLGADLMNDVGVVNCNLPDEGIFGANETITVDIFNFGMNDASNFDVTLQIDGGAVITETFTGTITSLETESFTFSATADLSVVGQTYEITICTALAGDEFAGNDCITKMVTNLEPNDIGVTEITAPVTGSGLGSEDVTITIENFGGNSQSDFDVSYTVDGGAAVVETVAGPLDAGETISYTFTTPADLSTPTSYEICATTLLAGDADASNDETCATVESLECIAPTNEQNFPVGPGAGTVTESVITVPNNVFVSDVNVTIDIEHTWAADLDIFLIGPDGTEVELSTDNGGGDDNYTNTTFDDAADTPITAGGAPFTGSFQPEGNLSDFNGSPTNGDWTLRITDDANADGGTLFSWTLELCGDDILDVGDNFAEDSEFNVIDRGNNQFDVSLLTTDFTDRLRFEVFNVLGQKLSSYTLENENGGYRYDLDMSFVSAGVYIVRLGNDNVGKVRKIIVR